MVKRYAYEFGISEYTEPIKAVMMQKSGGKGSGLCKHQNVGTTKNIPISLILSKNLIIL